MFNTTNEAAAAQQHTRRSWRLHRSTFAVLLPTSCLLVLLIVPGEYCDEAPATEILGLGPLTFEHGWPWVYLTREVELAPNVVRQYELAVIREIEPPVTLPDHSVPWLQRWAWSFQGELRGKSAWATGDAATWRPGILALDLFVATLSLAILAAALEWRHRRRRLWQISLSEFVGLTFLIAGGLGWWMYNAQRFQDERDAVQRRKSVSSGPSYVFAYRGPVWLRRAVGISHLEPFHRVVLVVTGTPPKGPDLLEHLKKIHEFSHVEEVDLASQSTIGDGLSYLGNLPRLRVVGLHMPLMTDSSFAHLKDVHTLRRLDVSDSRSVTGDALQHLSGMTNLEYLRLSRTGIDSQGLRHISHLKGLEVLALDDTAVDDEALRHIGPLVNLRQLGLAGTRLRGPRFINLRDLEKLQVLTLDRTAITDDDLAHIEELHSLMHLSIRATGISQSAVRGLARAFPKCKIRSDYRLTKR